MPTNVVRQVDGPDPSHGDTSNSRAPANYADEEARSWCHRTSPRPFFGAAATFAPGNGGGPSELTGPTNGTAVVLRAREGLRRPTSDHPHTTGRLSAVRLRTTT